jgi:hypothetical protein
MIRPEFGGRKPPTRKVLLIAQILVADDEQLETRQFGQAQQRLKYLGRLPLIKRTHLLPSSNSRPEANNTTSVQPKPAVSA